MPFSVRKPIELHANENPYPFSPECNQMFDSLDYKNFSFYSKVTPSLKDRLSDMFSVSKDQLILGHGSEDILKQAFHWLLKKGDKVMLPSVGWYYYQQLVEEIGAEVIFYPMIEKEDCFEFDIQETVNILKNNNIKLLCIFSPINPIGGVISKDDLFQILDAMPKETHCIFDEAYWGFKEAEYQTKDLVDKYPILVLRTFSKLFALAGFRVGFAFINKVWNPFAKLMSRYLGFNHFSELVAVTVLNSLDYYKKLAQTILLEAKKYYDQLKPLGVKVFKTYGNFVFMRFTESQFNLLKKELVNYGIIIKFFDSYKEPQFKNSVRISIGLPKENDYVLETMTSLLKEAN